MVPGVLCLVSSQLEADGRLVQAVTGKVDGLNLLSNVIAAIQVLLLAAY